VPSYCSEPIFNRMHQISYLHT